MREQRDERSAQRHPEHERAEAEQQPTSITSRVSRERTKEARILRPRHRCRDQTLEQPLLPARIHDGEAQAPDPAAHQVHTQQPRHQEIDVARPRARCTAAPCTATGSPPAGRPLERIVHQQSRRAALGPLVIVAVFHRSPRAPGTTTSATRPVRSASAAARAPAVPPRRCRTPAQRFDHGSEAGPRSTTATRVCSGARFRKAMPSPPRAAPERRRPRRPPPARGRTPGSAPG